MEATFDLGGQCLVCECVPDVRRPVVKGAGNFSPGVFVQMICQTRILNVLCNLVFNLWSKS